MFQENKILPPVLAIVALTITMHAPDVHAGAGLAALSAIGDSLSKSVDVWAESERQKELMRYQHELEMQRIQREQAEAQRQQLENQKRQQAEAQRQQLENQRRQQAEAEARKIAEAERKRLEMSTGTGFFINPNGYLVTNYHVIEDKSEFAIRDLKGKFYRAELVAKDSQRDLALLKIEGVFPSLRVGNSDSVTKGQRVLTLGYPQVSIQGNESKVTDGIVSSFSGIQNDGHWFQISVPIQGGNSGGPLVTESGTVIGVVVATANVSKFYKLTGNIPQNVNYAIKSNVLNSFLKDFHIVNTGSSKNKTPIDGVDQATVLVVAKSGPLNVKYSISPAQEAREERERFQLAADEAKRRKAEDAENKRQTAVALVEEAKRLKEEKLAEKRRLKEDRLAERKQNEERVGMEKRNGDVRKTFPDWPATYAGELFTAWLKQQPDDAAKKVNSPKSSDVIAVLVRYEIEQSNFTETYRKQQAEKRAQESGVVVPTVEAYIQKWPAKRAQENKIVVSSKVYVGSIVEVSKEYGFVVAKVDRTVSSSEQLAFEFNGKEIVMHPEKQNGNRLSLTLTSGGVVDSFIGGKIYVRH